MPETEDLTDDLRERLAKEAFVSDDFGGHHQANGSPFAYSPYTWESIPEDGRANYRRLVGDLWPVIVEHFAAREAAARREALLEAEERVSKAEDELRRVKAASLYADGHMQVIVDMDRRYDRLRAHADQTEQELDKARARVEEYAAIKAHLAASIRSEKAASAKVARVEALVEEWEQPGWVPTGIWVTRLIRAALAEPERDEEDGRDDTPPATPEQIEASRAFLAAQAEWDELRKQVRG